MPEIYVKEESYTIIGICMEVHNTLGPGFLEVVYKDALEYEFSKVGICYEREKKYEVIYKDVILRHQFSADFVVYDSIILEAKGVKGGLTDEHLAQSLNYLKVSGNRLALAVNFGEMKLNYKRVLL